eukprot:668367-Amphidinium_carterae.1
MVRVVLLKSAVKLPVMPESRSRPKNLDMLKAGIPATRACRKSNQYAKHHSSGPPADFVFI